MEKVNCIEQEILMNSFTNRSGRKNETLNRFIYELCLRYFYFSPLNKTYYNKTGLKIV